MKQLFYILLAGFLLAGCGASIDPDAYLEERTAQATVVDEYVASHLSYKSLPEYTIGNGLWNVQVGYMNAKPVIVKMMAADKRQDKWWIYPDTATGNAVFLKEETRGKDGKGVRNLFAYKDTSLVIAKAGPSAYQPESNNDIRLTYSEVNRIMKQVLTAVEADRADLSKAANDARKMNAQFFAAGNEPAWSLIINPSLNEILYNEGIGSQPKKFSYASPDTGPLGESVYELRSMNDKLKITVASKWCTDASGKVFPYSVVISSETKAVSGCGILLQ